MGKKNTAKLEMQRIDFKRRLDIFEERVNELEYIFEQLSQNETQKYKERKQILMRSWEILVIEPTIHPTESSERDNTVGKNCVKRWALRIFSKLTININLQIQESQQILSRKIYLKY